MIIEETHHPIDTAIAAYDALQKKIRHATKSCHF